MSSKWPPTIATSNSPVAGGHDVARPREPDRAVGNLTMTETIEAQTHISALFTYIRQVLDRPAYDIAMELHTSQHVIKALEKGRFDRLPDWPETHRVVTAYMQLVDIDPTPTLHVLRPVADAQSRHGSPAAPRATYEPTNLSPAPPVRSPTSVSPTPQPAQPAPSVFEPTPVEPPVKWRKGHSGKPVPSGAHHESDNLAGEEAGGPVALSKAVNAKLATMVRTVAKDLNRTEFTNFSERLANWNLSKRTKVSAAASLISIIAFAAAISSRDVARFANASLPSPLGAAVMTIHNSLTAPREYERDGMRWIEATDPRSRRADKLRGVDE